MLGHLLVNARLLCAVLMLSAAAASPTFLRAEAPEPLHVRIDRLIDRTSLGTASPAASDAAFLRRIHLDLTGSIPPASAVREFLADTRPDKRIRIIDDLLDSPSYARQMARTFDLWLMERRKEKHVKRQEWEAFLLAAVTENKPWNELVGEILAADGTDELNRSAAAFYLYRDGEPNLLTRDVGRVFFGMDLQCCQCHDHPLIGDYLQADYYGIFAFLSPGFLFTDKDKKVFFAEKAPGEVTFTSVFTQEKDETRPRLPNGFELVEPTLPAGEEYIVKPDNKDKLRPIPKFSRREQLATLAADGKSLAFNRNIVNRLWGHMMGRGLVEPVDLHHPGNPPSHPELLDLLATEFVASGYDVQKFLRELALTKTYQRAFDLLPATALASRDATAAVAECRQEEERLVAALDQAKVAADEARNQRMAAEGALDTATSEHTEASGLLVGARKAADDASARLADAEQQQRAKQVLADALAEARDKSRLAAEKLAEDEELVRAAAVFADRAGKLAAEFDEARKAFDAAKAAADSATATHQAAQQRVATLQQQLDAARQKVAATREDDVAAQREFASRLSQRDQIAARVEVAEALAEHAQLFQAWQLADRKWSESVEQLAAQQQEATELNARLPMLDATLAAANQAREQALRAAADAESRLAGLQQTADVISAAADAAAVASEKLADDAELMQAAKTFAARHTAVAVQLAEASKQLQESMSVAKMAEETRVTAEKTHRDATQRAAALEKSIGQLEADVSQQEAARSAARLAFVAFEKDFTANWSERFFVAPLAPLTPEQIAWSVMQATGQVDRQRAAAVTEVDKSLPIDPNDPNDATRLDERERAIEKYVYEKLSGNEATFVRLFGHADGQPQSDFFATVDQALFFANAGTLPSWLAPSGDNLTDRLGSLKAPEEIANELYISVLARQPDETEVADVASYLSSRPESKPAALQEMAWALIASAEFRFRH